VAETSRRAAGPARRGGLENIVFVVAGIECPPVELAGLADEVTILFPWGSLLRGALAIDDAAAAGIASLVSPGGRVTAYTSVTDRDGLDLPPLDETGDALAERWSRHGLVLDGIAPATMEDVAATGSSWARRLASDPDRPVRRIVLCRPVSAEDGLAKAR
jgi:16S rRNA (adenine(1408)-N(1))-methyltransferase